MLPVSTSSLGDPVHDPLVEPSTPADCAYQLMTKTSEMHIERTLSQLLREPRMSTTYDTVLGREYTYWEELLCEICNPHESSTRIRQILALFGAGGFSPDVDTLMHILLRISEERVACRYDYREKCCTISAILTAFGELPEVAQLIDGSEWLAYFGDRALALLGVALERLSLRAQENAYLLTEMMVAHADYLDLPGTNTSDTPFRRVLNAVNIDDRDREPFLADLMQKQHVLSLSFALKHGCNPNLRLLDGTPLVFLLPNDDYSVQRALLEANPDLTVTTPDGSTVLDDYVPLIKRRMSFEPIVAAAVQQGCAFDTRLQEKSPPIWLLDFFATCSPATERALHMSIELDRSYANAVAPQDRQGLLIALYTGQEDQIAYWHWSLWDDLLSTCGLPELIAVLEHIATEADLPHPWREIALCEKTLRHFLKACLQRDPLILWMAHRLYHENFAHGVNLLDQLPESPGVREAVVEILKCEPGERNRAVATYLSEKSLPLDERVMTVLGAACAAPYPGLPTSVFCRGRYCSQDRDLTISVAIARFSGLWTFDVIVDEYTRALQAASDPLTCTLRFLEERLRGLTIIDEGWVQQMDIDWQSVGLDVRKVSTAGSGAVALLGVTDGEETRRNLEQRHGEIHAPELLAAQRMVGCLIHFYSSAHRKPNGWLMNWAMTATERDAVFLESQKARLSGLAPLMRRKELIEAVDELAADERLSLQQMTLALSALENISLSRRVSNLGSLSIYHRQIPRKGNHPLTCQGLAALLREQAPNELILAATDCTKLAIDKVVQGLENRRHCWILLGYQDNLHITLLLLQKVEGGVELKVLDSLGAYPNPQAGREYTYGRGLNTVRVALDQHFNIVQVHHIARERQVDETNCAAFVAADFTTALALLYKNEALFPSGNPHPDFFEIGQYRSQVSQPQARPHWLRATKLPSGQTGNAKALFVGLRLLRNILSQHVAYPQADVHHEGPSDDDTVVVGCVLC